MKNSMHSALGLSFLVFVFIGPFFFSSCDLIEDILGKKKDDNKSYGDTLWIHEISGDSLFIDFSLAIGKDGSVYYAKSGGTATWASATIVALNSETGQVKWESPKLDHHAISSPIIVGDDGTLYVIGFYTLYAINPNNGQFIWTWKVPEKLPNPNGPGEVYTYGQIGALALTNEGDLVLGSVGTGSYYRGLYSVNKNGIKNWHNLNVVGTAIISGIIVDKSGMLHYYTNLKGVNSLLGVQAATGAINWSISAGNGGSASNTLLVGNDGLVMGSFQTATGDPFKLYRVNPASGQVQWASTSQSTTTSILMGPDGAIYQYFQFDNGINRFDAANGNKKVFAQNLIADRIGAINEDNQLLIVNDNSAFTSLTAFRVDGSIDWEVKVNGLLREPIVVGNNKLIYGIINNHSTSRLPKKIIALQGNARLSGSGWPCVTHDNRNTSNVNKLSN
jgi:outer membrane protein assembly factor BamB